MGFKLVFLGGLWLGLMSCAQAPVTPPAAVVRPAGELTPYTGLGASSISAELVKKYAPPAEDPVWLSKAQALLDIRGASAGALSNDGKTLYYASVVTGTSQIWKMEGAFGYPHQMTAGQDTTSVAALSQDGRLLILQRDRNGEENPGIYAQSTSGGPLRKIYHEKGIRAEFQHLTKDSRYIYFAANSESPESSAIHKYDLKTGNRQVVFSEPGTWHIADVRDDKDFLLEKSTGSLWSEYYFWNPETHELHPVLGQGEHEDYKMAFAREANSYLVSTPKFGDFRRLYLYKAGQFKALTGDGKKDLKNFVIDPSLGRIYLTWNDQGYTRLQVLDAGTYKEIPLDDFKNADHVDFAGGSHDGRFAEILVEANSQPKYLVVKDWKTGQVKKWMDANLPEIEMGHLAKVELDSYTARDGTKIPYFIRRSAKCRNSLCPVIIQFHGGPEVQALPGFSPTAQAFADAGFIFVEPNVRGSDGYGKAWLAADDGPKRLNVITDIEDAALELRKKLSIEGHAPKIGVMGGSYGGYSTLYAMTRFAGAFDAGAANVGMSNLLTFLNNTAPYRRQLRISEYGDPVKDQAALIQLSPMTYIDQVKAPLMPMQGLNDPRVPVGEALQIYDRLEKKGIPVELLIYADEGHGARKRNNRASQLAQILRFFQKHLQ